MDFKVDFRPRVGKPVFNSWSGGLNPKPTALVPAFISSGFTPWLGSAVPQNLNPFLEPQGLAFKDVLFNYSASLYSFAALNLEKLPFGEKIADLYADLVFKYGDQAPWVVGGAGLGAFSLILLTGVYLKASGSFIRQARKLDLKGLADLLYKDINHPDLLAQRLTEIGRKLPAQAVEIIKKFLSADKSLAGSKFVPIFEKVFSDPKLKAKVMKAFNLTADELASIENQLGFLKRDTEILNILSQLGAEIPPRIIAESIKAKFFTSRQGKPINDFEGLVKYLSNLFNSGHIGPEAFIAILSGFEGDDNDWMAEIIMDKILTRIGLTAVLGKLRLIEPTQAADFMLNLPKSQKVKLKKLFENRLDASRRENGDLNQYFVSVIDRVLACARRERVIELVEWLIPAARPLNAEEIKFFEEKIKDPLAVFSLQTSDFKKRIFEGGVKRPDLTGWLEQTYAICRSGASLSLPDQVVAGILERMVKGSLIKKLEFRGFPQAEKIWKWLLENKYVVQVDNETGEILEPKILGLTFPSEVEAADRKKALELLEQFYNPLSPAAAAEQIYAKGTTIKDINQKYLPLLFKVMLKNLSGEGRLKRIFTEFGEQIKFKYRDLREGEIGLSREGQLNLLKEERKPIQELIPDYSKLTFIKQILLNLLREYLYAADLADLKHQIFKVLDYHRIEGVRLRLLENEPLEKVGEIAEKDFYEQLKELALLLAEAEMINLHKLADDQQTQKKKLILDFALLFGLEEIVFKLETIQDLITRLSGAGLVSQKERFALILTVILDRNDPNFTLKSLAAFLGTLGIGNPTIEEFINNIKDKTGRARREAILAFSEKLIPETKSRGDARPR